MIGWAKGTEEQALPRCLDLVHTHHCGWQEVWVSEVRPAYWNSEGLKALNGSEYEYTVREPTRTVSGSACYEAALHATQLRCLQSEIGYDAHQS
jgi:hypothetical protein